MDGIDIGGAPTARTYPELTSLAGLDGDWRVVAVRVTPYCINDIWFWWHWKLPARELAEFRRLLRVGAAATVQTYLPDGRVALLAGEVPPIYRNRFGNRRES